MSKNKSKILKIPKYILIPIIMMIGIVPMIVHTYQYDSNLSQFDWAASNGNVQVDNFFAYKMIGIIILAIVMVSVIIYRYFKLKEKLYFDNMFYLLLIYAMLVVMSAIFSPYKYWVVHGTFELFEPVWVVLGYIILCYYTYNFIREEKQIVYILSGISIGVVIITLIGDFQYWGLDFFKSDLGKYIIVSPKWWNQIDNISFNVDNHVSYATLYNPNFLSLYYGMLIPMIFCLIIAVKKIGLRILLIGLELLCVICMKGSGSSSGWIALVVGTMILFMVLMSRQKKFCYIGGAILIVVIVTGGIICNTTTVGKNIKDSIMGTYSFEERYALNKIETNRDDVKLHIWNNVLSISYSEDVDTATQLVCKDSDDAVLEMNLVDEEMQIYVINDTRFDNVKVQLINFDGIPGMRVYIDNACWSFAKMDEDGYEYVNNAGKAVKVEQIKEGHLFKEDAMSYRGHIWNNTIPLLGKHVIMGSGANTYMFEYPQNDYLGQVYIYGANSYEVKAHSWYLQQWIETGLLGTLALVGFLLGYIIRSIRIYRRVDLHKQLSWVGFGLFAAVLVYMIVAVANDSNVCTAPVFWGMLGLGMAVNRMLVAKENLFVKVEDTQTTENDNADVQQKNAAASVIKSVKAEIKNGNQKTSGKKQSRKQRKNQKK